MSPSTSLIRASSRLSIISRRSPRFCPSTTAFVRSLNIQDRILHDSWFSGSLPVYATSNIVPDGPDGEPRKPTDPRTVKLGKTLRILQERLPTLLQSPLPQEILSPQITLQLFPSTHSHLPTVSGRVAYIAALWSSPIAWGRLPLVNVKLHILSERIIKNQSSSPLHYRPEKLIVRWRTCGKTKNKGVGGNYQGLNSSSPADKITEFLGGGKGEDDKKEFTGLFIFEFDEEGRIVTHTIEHVQEGGNWENGVGARVVGLTDWLLGGLKGRGDSGQPCPAYFRCPGRKY